MSHTPNPVSVSDATLAGWSFADSNAMEWQPLGEKIAMKMLGAADVKVIAMFKFEAGYVGGSHHHDEPEFTFVLEGSVISNGVVMTQRQAYAVVSGTDHTEFRSETGCTLVSVFKAPG